jgi:hypothetical protein
MKPRNQASVVPFTTIESIGNQILNEMSSAETLCAAINAFVQTCSTATGITPDPSFDAWAEDALLDGGVAINPQAAAQCALDYQRTVVFIRGVYAALIDLRARFPTTTLKILYAGCGPYATLLLPLLAKFAPGELRASLLDTHQESLDSVAQLLNRFGLSTYNVDLIQGDACHYQHPEKLHLIIAETLQKALEQEPQFAVTAHLAPQLLPAGVFIPQEIEVDLCLADLATEQAIFTERQRSNLGTLKERDQRYPIATLCTLSPEQAPTQLRLARHNAVTKKLELAEQAVSIPADVDLNGLEAALFTRILVFGEHGLNDYEAQITLPLKCHALMPLVNGANYRVSYQLGSYPMFSFEHVKSV